MSGKLTLYTCTVCGFVGTMNFRDTCCPACKVCMKVDEIRVFLSMPGDDVLRGPAPHTDESVVLTGRARDVKV